MKTPNAATGCPPGFDSLQQAAEWFALLRSDTVSDEDHRAWQHWLGSSAEHREAWQRMETIGRRFSSLANVDGEGAASTLRTLRRERASRRRVLNTLVLAGGGTLLGWNLWRQQEWPQALITGLRADFSTGVGEIRELTLDDGTRLWLNTASAVDVALGSDSRQLWLHQGELLIDTAADPRPFVVHTRHGSLRPLGTRFAVRQERDASWLAVYEGRVSISAGTQERILPAGSKTRFSTTTIATPRATDENGVDWSRGVLRADNMRLDALLLQLGRYRHGHLGVAPEVASLRVMGSFPLQDTDLALDMLESALPVRVRRTLPWWVSIMAREPE
ncbi:MAG TPA: FecR domain-containing protein [Hyphomicrobiales bacterium]|nr:FecR domain-containing protein [Hyphomicrobiales bacterium]